MPVLADVLRRLLVHLAGSDTEVAPELLEVERSAAIAMAACTCGHIWHVHEHTHIRTYCDACGCGRFRPAELPPPPSADLQPTSGETVLIRLRVAVWTRAWRDSHGTGPSRAR